MCLSLATLFAISTFGCTYMSMPKQQPVVDITNIAYVQNKPKPSLREEKDVRRFYRQLMQALMSDDAHMRYRAYFYFSREDFQAPSDTYRNDVFDELIAADQRVTEVVERDLRDCDGDLARGAAFMANSLRLERVIRNVYRFEDLKLSETVRLQLLKFWLNGLARIDKKAAETYGPLLDDMATNDSSPLLREAAPLYKWMIQGHGEIRFPNDRRAPTNDRTEIDFSLTHEGQIYMPEEVDPLPSPGALARDPGICPP